MTSDNVVGSCPLTCNAGSPHHVLGSVSFLDHVKETVSLLKFVLVELYTRSTCERVEGLREETSNHSFVGTPVLGACFLEHDGPNGVFDTITSEQWVLLAPTHGWNLIINDDSDLLALLPHLHFENAFGFVFPGDQVLDSIRPLSKSSQRGQVPTVTQASLPDVSRSWLVCPHVLGRRCAQSLEDGVGALPS